MQRLSSVEFTYLKQYYIQEPFGAWRDNLNSAQIASILANANRNPKKTKPFTINDFMYRDRKQREEDEKGAFLSFLNAMAKPKNG